MLDPFVRGMVAKFAQEADAEKKAILGTALGALALGGLAHKFSPEIANQAGRLGESLGQYGGRQAGAEGRLGRTALGEGMMGSGADMLLNLLPQSARETMGHHAGGMYGKSKAKGVWNQYGVPGSAVGGAFLGHEMLDKESGAGRPGLDRRYSTGSGLAELARRAAGVSYRDASMDSTDKEPVKEVSRNWPQEPESRIPPEIREILEDDMVHAFEDKTSAVKLPPPSETQGLGNWIAAKSRAQGAAKLPEKLGFWDQALMLGVPALAAMGGGQIGRGIGERIAGKPGLMARAAHAGTGGLVTPASVRAFQQKGQKGEQIGAALAALLAANPVYGNISKRPRFEEEQAQGYGY